MSVALPLIGVLLALVATFLSRREVSEEVVRPVWHDLLTALALYAVAAIAAFRFAPEIDRVGVLIGLALGMATCLVAARSAFRMPAQFAWGVAFAAACHLIPGQDRGAVQMAALAGAGLAGVLVGAPVAALALAAVVAVDRLGALSGSLEVLPQSGTVAGLAFALAAVVSEVDRKKAPLQWAAAVLLPAVFAYMVGAVWLKDMPLASVMIVGVVAGAVLHLLLAEGEEASPLSVGVGFIISIGLATVGFAFARNEGMAFSLLAALAVLAIFGNGKALLTLGPLFGLVMFRIFRSSFPETARAFDIGQHYALIGLILGAILPLIVVDWTSRRQATVLFAVAAILWGALLLGATPTLIAFLGAYGTVGLLIGLGLSGLLEAVRQGSSIAGLSVAVGMAGTVLTLYGWLARSIDLAREEKVNLLVGAGIGFAVLAISIGLLSRRQVETQVEVK